MARRPSENRDATGAHGGRTPGGLPSGARCWGGREYRRNRARDHARGWRPLPGSERLEYLATRGVVEAVKVNRAVTLVAQNLDECRPALFLGRLQTALRDAEQVHLQRFHQEIFGIPAIRTRKRQNLTPFRPPIDPGRDECIPGLASEIQDYG